MTPQADPRLRLAYLDAIKRSVTNYAYLGGDTPFDEWRVVNHYDVLAGTWKIEPYARPCTLLSKKQLDLIEGAVTHIQQANIPGDLIEAGIWRGGAIILMRALLNAYDIEDRKIFAADSFAGIPVNVRAKGDPVDQWPDRWVASLEDVQRNIWRFGMLDDRIKFIVGFFEDSLAALANERFALIRLDSDSYDSVDTSLEHLYPLLSQGGIAIIDDWHLVGCKKAVEDYRERHSIADPIQVVDGNAYWVKSQDYQAPRSP